MTQNRFNITNNTIRLTVDGEVFKDTPIRSWIPSAAIPSDNTTESSPCENRYDKKFGDGTFMVRMVAMYRS